MIKTELNFHILKIFNISLSLKLKLCLLFINLDMMSNLVQQAYGCSCECNTRLGSYDSLCVEHIDPSYCASIISSYKRTDWLLTLFLVKRCKRFLFRETFLNCQANTQNTFISIWVWIRNMIQKR